MTFSSNTCRIVEISTTSVDRYHGKIEDSRLAESSDSELAFPSLLFFTFSFPTARLFVLGDCDGTFSNGRNMRRFFNGLSSMPCRCQRISMRLAEWHGLISIQKRQDGTKKEKKRDAKSREEFFAFTRILVHDWETNVRLFHARKWTSLLFDIYVIGDNGSVTSFVNFLQLLSDFDYSTVRGRRKEQVEVSMKTNEGKCQWKLENVESVSIVTDFLKHLWDWTSCQIIDE